MSARPYVSLILSSLLALSAFSSAVQAQAWLSDRSRAEGRGIRVGDLVLHPGVGTEGGYVTNPFYSEPGNVEGSAAFRVAPHLYLSTLSPQRREREGLVETPGWLAFRGGLSGSFNHYFTSRARDMWNANLDLDATLAPERPISLQLFEQLNHVGIPFPTGAELDGAIAAPVAGAGEVRVKALDYGRWYESAAARLLFRTPGALLQGSVGYRFGYNWFDDDSFDRNDNMIHTALADLAWKFLPQTALFWDGSYSYQNFMNQNSNERATELTTLSTNDLVTTRVGVRGAVTSRIATTLAVGYAAGLFRRGPDGGIVTVDAEVRYVPSETTEAAVGFDRGLLRSYLGNYQERNRIYLRGRWMFLGSLLTTARVGVEFLRFGDDLIQGKRKDTRYFGELNGEYRFVDWLAVTGQANFLVDDTDFVYLFGGAAGSGVESRSDPAKYTAAEFWLGLRAFL